MVLKVAKTVYETEPDKKLAAVDVYSTTVETNPVNSETKLPDTLNNASIDDLPFNKVNNLYTDFEKDFRDSNKTLEQALSSFKGIVANPKEFTQSLSKDILNDTLKSVGYAGTSDDILAIVKDGPNVKNILNVVGNSDSNLKVVINNVEKTIAGKDLSSVTGVASLIGELTGDSELVKILDISPRVSVIKSFVNQAMKLRIPEAVDLLVDSIEDIGDRRDLRLYSTLNAAYNSDVDFLNKQIQSEDIGAGAINGMYPDVTTILLSNYVLVNRVPSKTEADKLIATLDSLDPNWLEYDRQGTTIPNVSSFAAATEDAIAVLLKSDRTFIPATLARQLDTKNMATVTLSMRPYTPATILDM